MHIQCSAILYIVHVRNFMCAATTSGSVELVERDMDEAHVQLAAPTRSPRRPSRSSLHLYLARAKPTSSIRRSIAAGIVGSIDRDLNNISQRSSVRQVSSTPSRMRPAICAAFERRERRVTTTLAVVIGAIPRCSNVF